MTAPPHEPSPQRVAATILDGAAHALAAHGQHASMSDVAYSSGVSRATVYRYFPTRAVLLNALASLTATRASSGLVSARIDEVPPIEGVRRAVRTLVEVGDPFVAVARIRARPDADALERRLAGPLQRLLERGQMLGAIRADVSSPLLAESLVALVLTVMAARPALGREDAIAVICDVFLQGAAAPSSTP